MSGYYCACGSTIIKDGENRYLRAGLWHGITVCDLHPLPVRLPAEPVTIQGEVIDDRQIES